MQMLQSFCKIRSISRFAVMDLENRISDPEHVPGSPSAEGGCAKTTCTGTVPV